MQGLLGSPLEVGLVVQFLNRLGYYGKAFSRADVISDEYSDLPSMDTNKFVGSHWQVNIGYGYEWIYLKINLVSMLHKLWYGCPL